ncbi:MAG: hypothetical protein SWQ30_02805 [Thermodesulfobacteriota bacterium]|nr:hypothetical protein [Thermodesulfobacteriota bacterium]
MNGNTLKLIVPTVILAATMFVSQAAGQPLLEDIVANVRRMSVPTQPYRVLVSQTVHKRISVTDGKPKSTGNTSTALSATQTQTCFEMTYDSVKGVSTEEVESRQDVAQEAVQGATASIEGTRQPEGVVDVAVDIPKLLKEIESMKDLTIESAVLDGRQHYEVSGRNENGFAYTVWVDVKHWYITRFTMDIMGNRFSETSLEYKETNDVWLPARIVITHASDGSRVDQVFGVYKLAE